MATNELDTAGETRLYRAFRECWHPVLFADELRAGPARARLCGVDLVVVALENEICVFDDLCAHRGTALSLGAVVEDGTRLRCAYHGWQYDRTGRCRLAPQRPDLSEHLRAQVRKYTAQEAYGLVWVCLSDAPRFPLPDFPQYADEAYVKTRLPAIDWRCSAPRRTENYCDLSHLAWVHDGYLGDSSHPEVPPHDVWREGPCVRMQAPPRDAETAPAAGNGALALASPRDLHAPGDRVPGVYRYWITMPLTVRLDMEFGDVTYVLFFHPTPVEAKVTRNFTVAACNLPGDAMELRDEIRRFQDLIYEQDRPIVESQRPEELAEDLSFELYLKGADLFHLVYRRYLTEIARG
jgi:vanillate O-demethylase monooxygenase subunit